MKSSGAKKCAKCEQVKPLDEFYNATASKDGKVGKCKPCSDAYHAEYRKRAIEPMMLNRVRRRAARDGRECTLTVSDIVVPDTCPIFGIPLRVSSGRMDDNSPSLDRLDNSRGYTPDNVRVISWKANQIKSCATAAELRLIADWMEREQQ